jgi:hypothetical protein
MTRIIMAILAVCLMCTPVMATSSADEAQVEFVVNNGLAGSAIAQGPLGDAYIDDTTRSLPIPLTSFIADSIAMAADATTNPGLVESGHNIYVNFVYGEACTATFMLPPDYAGGALVAGLIIGADGTSITPSFSISKNGYAYQQPIQLTKVTAVGGNDYLTASTSGNTFLAATLTALTETAMIQLVLQGDNAVNLFGAEIQYQSKQ